MNVSVPKLATAIAVGVAALVVIVLARGPASSVKLVDQSQGREMWNVVRRMEARGFEPPDPAGEAETTLVREPLDEHRAADFFPIRGNQVYDPHCWLRYEGDLNVRIQQAEYPGGGWTRRTNSLGLREDHELPAVRPDIFVLVAGDSHTEGVCSNDLSFANQLEAALSRAQPGRSVEVLNTGCSSYSFYNYLGALERFEDRRPDVFVTAVFGGNDFVECLALYHYFHRTAGAPSTRDEWDRQSALHDVGEPALAQGLASIGYFSRHPDQFDFALRAAREVCDEIRRRCDALGAAWIVVYIPSEFDLPGSSSSDLLVKAKETLQLTEDDLQIGNRLGDELLHALRGRAVAVIDLREELGSGEWFWSEHHINLRAQERIAELLLPRVLERIPAR